MKGRSLKRGLFAESHTNYWIFEKRLSNGWIPGRKVVGRLLHQTDEAVLIPGRDEGQHRRAISLI